MQNALGLTSDRVYHWRLLFEEYGLTIKYVKGIHNTVADAISPLDHIPISNDRDNCTTFTQCWCHYTETSKETGVSMKIVFANEIAESQSKDT